MNRRPWIANVLIQPTRELSVSSANVQQLSAVTAARDSEKLFDEVQVPGRSGHDEPWAEEPIGRAEFGEDPFKVAGHLTELLSGKDSASEVVRGGPR
jgi:hypothetical protein